MEAVGGRLDDDAAAEMKPARRVRMASSCGVFVIVMVVCFVFRFVFCGSRQARPRHWGHRTPDTPKERTQHICPVQEVESCRC